MLKYLSSSFQQFADRAWLDSNEQQAFADYLQLRGDDTREMAEKLERNPEAYSQELYPGFQDEYLLIRNDADFSPIEQEGTKEAFLSYLHQGQAEACPLGKLGEFRLGSVLVEVRAREEEETGKAYLAFSFAVPACGAMKKTCNEPVFYRDEDPSFQFPYLYVDPETPVTLYRTDYANLAELEQGMVAAVSGHLGTIGRIYAYDEPRDVLFFASHPDILQPTPAPYLNSEQQAFNQKLLEEEAADPDAFFEKHGYAFSELSYAFSYASKAKSLYLPIRNDVDFLGSSVERDLAAYAAAKADGLTTIDDMRGLLPGRIVDTAENRALCAKALLELPRFRSSMTPYYLHEPLLEAFPDWPGTLRGNYANTFRLVQSPWGRIESVTLFHPNGAAVCRSKDGKEGLVLTEPFASQYLSPFLLQEGTIRKERIFFGADSSGYALFFYQHPEMEEAYADAKAFHNAPISLSAFHAQNTERVAASFPQFLRGKDAWQREFQKRETWIREAAQKGEPAKTGREQFLLAMAEGKQQGEKDIGLFAACQMKKKGWTDHQIQTGLKVLCPLAVRSPEAYPVQTVASMKQALAKGRES